MFKVGDKVKVKDVQTGSTWNSASEIKEYFTGELLVIDYDGNVKGVLCHSDTDDIIAWFKWDEVVLVEQTDELFDWCIYEATAGIFFTGVFNATREEANMLLLNTIDKRKNLAYTLYKMTKSRTERKVVEEKLIVEEF